MFYVKDGTARTTRLNNDTSDVPHEEDLVEEVDATWSEVCQTCCVHSPKEWGQIFIGIMVVCFFLYFFLVGLDLLGSSAKVLGGCTAGALVGDQTNPVAGLMIGILVTVLVQSSSTTTSIIVSLVGAESITVKAAIYMLMGANIGTSVTNTIVAMGHLGDGDGLERAFAGATVHDMFNFLSVAILFPLEILTHFLYYLSLAMVGGGNLSRMGQGKKWTGPLKKIVEPINNAIIIPNKSIPKDIANGGNCNDYYPVTCKDGLVDAEHCTKVGLIKCDKERGCPVFFQNGATRKDDEISGAACLVLGLAILIICLVGLVTALHKMLMGMSKRILHKATDVNGYLAILIGVGLTILVQSSSITTSALTPLVGVGAIRLEQMYPLTLGANIGTTGTGILSSLVSNGTDALQVALCHLCFNICGIIIWYPLPLMRNVPLNAARALGYSTRVWRGFPVVYIISVFFLFPLILLGLSSLFTQNSKGLTVLGSFATAVIIILVVFFAYKWCRAGCKERTVAKFKHRQRMNEIMVELPDNIVYLKSEIVRLREHTGLPDPTTDVPTMCIS